MANSVQGSWSAAEAAEKHCSELEDVLRATLKARASDKAESARRWNVLEAEVAGERLRFYPGPTHPPNPILSW